MSGRQAISRYWRGCLIFVWLTGGTGTRALANDAPEIPRIVTHDNTQVSGKLEDGVLTLRLEIREGEWHPDADDGPGMPIFAFAEEGKSPSIPGPMIRAPQGTRIKVSVKNMTLFFPAFLHGLNQRPGKADEVIKIPAGGTQEVTFLAGEPGTYYYWANTGVDVPVDSRQGWDTQLDGAFIVDAPGTRNDDRVMMIGMWYAWVVPFDFNRGYHQFLTMNGKSWPHTTKLSYEMGETIHWRVINASVGIHPMHLHGAYFQVDSTGDAEVDTRYSEGERRSVVTELMPEGHTMAVSWKPSHAGNWIFHCHLADHFAEDNAKQVSEVMGLPIEKTEHHQGMGMAGLVVGIQIKPGSATSEIAASAAPVRKLELVVDRSNDEATARRPIQINLTDGTNSSSTAEGSELGPTIVLHRDERTEITVVNRLTTPTAIHWHGIELESYYDGVVDLGGDSRQMTPRIEPGASFVARMTPPRAGTFIYHTHWHDMDQLTKGLYGALIVLEPGEKYDPEHDRVFVVSRGGADIFYSPMLVNGLQHPVASELRAGERYRLRFINITPADDGTQIVLAAAGKAVVWTPVAKDGAELPMRYRKDCEAKLKFGAGETYDFAFRPKKSGTLELQTSFIELHTNVPITVLEAKDAVAERR
jgi:FtsP/CotA-like multicopper oxidase with cupredoxin domain